MSSGLSGAADRYNAKIKIQTILATDLLTN